MKKYYLLTALICLIILSQYSQQVQISRSKNVILIGLDGMGAYGFQEAVTPYMNEMAKDGALSIKARSVLVSDSSPNWTSMLTGEYQFDKELLLTIGAPIIITSYIISSTKSKLNPGY